MRNYIFFALTIFTTLCSCSSSTEKKEELTYTYTYPFGGSLESEDTLLIEDTTPQQEQDVKVVGESDIYHEGFEAGYNDGEDDYLDRCGYEGNYNDDCEYSGRKRRDYERGYEDGYDEGYGDAKGDDGSDDPEGGSYEDE